MLASIPADLSLLLHICTEAELLRGRKLNPFDNQGSYRISEELSGPDQDQLAGPLMWSLRENCVGLMKNLIWLLDYYLFTLKIS